MVFSCYFPHFQQKICYSYLFFYWVGINLSNYYRLPSLFCTLFFDYFYFGEWHIVQLNFLKFNFIEAKSANFGVKPFIAYFDSYLPDHLGILFPFALIGLLIFAWKNKSKMHIVLFLTVIFNFFVYSYIAHKETR